jgi:O-antigen/teichoic acid export membrane protein
MNVFYLISVLTSRLANMAAVLLFSYFLSTASFGIYATVATNALLLHLVLGAWISGYAWRVVSSDTGASELQGTLRHIGGLAWIAVAMQLVAFGFFALFVLENEHLGLATAVLAWSISILLFETTMVVLNATGEARGYSLATFLRGMMTLLIPLALLAAGASYWAAIIGSISANAIALLCCLPALSSWFRLPEASITRQKIHEAVTFGIASVAALNVYMLVNAAVRNVIAIDLGPDATGHASLAADIFFAPIALFATAFSLSHIPRLYADSAGTGSDTSGAYFEFLNSMLVVIVPYVLGGVMVATGLCNLLLDPDDAKAIGSIAPWVVIQAGILTALSTLTTIGLTRGRPIYATAISLLSIMAALAASFYASYVQSDLVGYCKAVTAALMVVMSVSFPFLTNKLSLKVNYAELGKSVLASLAMFAAIWAVSRFETPFLSVLQVFLGGTVFLLVSLILGLKSLRTMLGRMLPKSPTV